MKYDYFLCSNLSSVENQKINAQVIETVLESGHSIFAPQIEMPIDEEYRPNEIFNGNIEAIRQSKKIIFVPMNGGEGVFFEIGVAFALKKHIIVLNPFPNKGYGKMITSLISQCEKRVNSMTDFKFILKNISSC